MDDITEAIYYAADNGADVINMSLGGIYLILIWSVSKIEILDYII